MNRLISTTITAAAFGAVLAALPAMAYEGTPDDFMQINQLFSQYSYDINVADGDAWAKNFAPDGVFDDPPRNCLFGHDALAALEGHHPGGIPGKDATSYHQATLGPLIYQDKDHATVHSTVEIFQEARGAAPNGYSGGTYDDKLVRLNGKWKFAYRFVTHMRSKERPNELPLVHCTPPAK